MARFTSVNPKPFREMGSQKDEVQVGVHTSVFARLWSAFKRAHHKNMAEIKDAMRQGNADLKVKLKKIDKDTKDNLEILRKKKEENPTDGMSTAQVWGTVAIIAVVITLIVGSLTPDTLDASKAMTLCSSRFHEGAIYGSDFSPWKSGHLEDDFRFTIHAAGTHTNMYGAEVKVTMVCLVNKLDYKKSENKADAVTSSVLRQGHI